MGRKAGSKNKKAEETPPVEGKVVSVTEKEATVEYHPQPETIVIPKGIEGKEENKKEPTKEKEPVKGKILVDKFLFYKLMMTSVKGTPFRGNAAVAKFAELVGITESEKQVKFWQEDVQEYLAKENSNG